MYIWKHIASLSAAAWIWLASLSPGLAQSPSVVVFAAASMKDALDGVAAQWGKETGKKATISYAASSALARQIESGAPAQIFISADLDWMDYLDRKQLIRAETRVNLLGNRIVLVAPRASAAAVKIAPDFPLAAMLGNRRLALADVNAVPAGKYAKAALEKLGVWNSISNRVAQAGNVRATLRLISRDEAALGIVYQTDATADRGVKVIGIFPENTHPPIIYPIALTTAPANADATALFAYLKSAAARPLYAAQGFVVLN